MGHSKNTSLLTLTYLSVIRTTEQHILSAMTNCSWNTKHTDMALLTLHSTLTVHTGDYLSIIPIKGYPRFYFLKISKYSYSMATVFYKSHLLRILIHTIRGKTHMVLHVPFYVPYNLVSWGEDVCVCARKLQSGK